MNSIYYKFKKVGYLANILIIISILFIVYGATGLIRIYINYKQERNNIIFETPQIKSIELSESEIIRNVNNARVKNNLKGLTISDELKKVASLKLIDMQNKHYFDHISPDNKSLKDFLKEVNYNYIYSGENLAQDYFDSNSVVDAWLNSPTHRDNILNPKLDEVGVAFEYVNHDGTNHLTMVMIFGKKKI